MPDLGKGYRKAVSQRNRGLTPLVGFGVVGFGHWSKGSDPSVYVLLYMLDFDAADVVDYAAS